MNYARIKKYDIANGPGMRASLYVSGCTHGCKGCFNEVAWNFNYGEKWTKEVEDDLYSLFGGTKKTTKTVERDRTVDEIESLPFIKTMLDSGAKMLYQYHSYNNGWDDEAFEFADGKNYIYIKK